MRKILGTFGVVAIASFFLVSCQKDHTCTCVVDGDQYVYSYKQETKKEAKTACDKQDAAAKIADPEGQCILD